MSLKEEMKEFKNQKRYVNAEFKDGGLELDINAGFKEVLALAMALLEQSFKANEKTTKTVLSMFIMERMTKGKK